MSAVADDRDFDETFERWSQAGSPRCLHITRTRGPIWEAICSAHPVARCAPCDATHRADGCSAPALVGTYQRGSLEDAPFDPHEEGRPCAGS